MAEAVELATGIGRVINYMVWGSFLVNVGITIYTWNRRATEEAFY